MRGLSVALPDGRLLLDEIDLTIAPREVVVLLGGSGAGKSTFSRVLFEPEELQRAGYQVSARSLLIDRDALGLVPQRGALFDHLDVRDNLELAQRRATGSAAGDAATWLSRVGLDPKLAAPGTSVGKLSGGQAQRVAVARVLASRRELLFLDEPSVGLDPQRVRLLARLLREQVRTLGISAIVVTHDLALAGGVADRLFLLSLATRKLEPLFADTWPGPLEELPENPTSDPASVPAPAPAPVSAPVSVSDPVSESVSVSDPVSASVSVSDPVSVSESVSVSDPVSASAPVSESESVSDPVSVSAPESESVSDPVPASALAPVSESDSFSASAPESASAPVSPRGHWLLALEAALVSHLELHADTPPRPGPPPSRSPLHRLAPLLEPLLAPFRTAGNALAHLPGQLLRHPRDLATIAARTLRQTLLRPLLFYAIVSTLIGYTVLLVVSKVGGAGVRADALVRQLGGSHIVALAPALSALLFVAASGSATNAWLGSMSLTKQALALDALGVDHRRYLLAPAWASIALAYLLVAAVFALGMIAGGMLVCRSLGVTDAWQLLTGELFDPRPERAVYAQRALLLVWMYAWGIASDVVAKGAAPKPEADAVTRAMTASVVSCTLWIVGWELVSVLVVLT